MTLSTRTKESIKTALAMTIAYGIALSMDWDRPYWAGFAVAMVSLATIGQSFNKATLRMIGTLMGMGVALTLIALFAQDRWPFILFLSIWIGLCTYMMAGTKRQYFWHVSGFVCGIICMDAGPDPVNAFDTAILRAQETGLGILVYSLVAIFLWPSSSRAGFEAAVGKLAATQHELYRAYLDLMKGTGDIGKAQSLKAQAIQEQTRFSQLLGAAEGDSVEVRELRRPWRRYQGQVVEFGETLERWHDSFAGLQALDVQRLLPNLAAFGGELDLRLGQIERMLDNQRPAQQPIATELALDEEALHALPHFNKAALAVGRKQLQRLEILTRSLFNSVSDLKCFGQSIAVHDAAAPPPAPFVPDPDRITAAARAMLILWLAWLTLIYVNGIPGGVGVVSMAVPIGMALATMPQVSVWQLFKPVMTSVLFAGSLYIFVMPKLSSFTGLGLLIFAATFAICHLFAAPRQVLGRAFGLALFVSIISVSNEQTYNFLSVANTAMMFPTIFLIIAVTAYIPFSPRPERAVQRLLGRFFRSSEYLMSTMHRDPGVSPTRIERWRLAFHTRELAMLPQKLGAWAGHIDTRALPGTTPQQVQSLVSSLQVLGYRMQELLEARDTPQAQFFVQELLADFQAWRLRVQQTFQRLSQDPTIGKQEAFRTRLDEVMKHLEARMRDTMDKSPDGQLGDRDEENFYYLLGTYRGTSEALVDYAGSTGDIDWARWREERFA
jgi:uncharacterized membrane protein YccC